MTKGIALAGPWLSRGAWAVGVCAVLTLPAAALAALETMPVEGASYNVAASMAENLQALTGKTVYVELDSGKSLVGVVKAVGDHLLHLEKLGGKEYFDALIRIDRISSIDTRFRQPKR